MSQINQRDCVKAGSWYSGSSNKLNGMMENWLDGCKVEVDNRLKFKCLIGPHAGYRHCGATLARGGIKTVFVLGPSHKFRFKGCALTSCQYYRTPFGSLEVDHGIIGELCKSNMFTDVGVRREENEHSLEMHLPFVFKIFGNKNIKIVPIMVSRFDESHSVDTYAKLLHPYFSRPDVFFSISSDFCHWGPRFRFTHRFTNSKTISSSIEQLDKLGVEAIFSKSSSRWDKYLEEYRNTICGRRAISIMLGILEIEKRDPEGSFDGLEWKLVGYYQSNRNVTEDETSVSYASCVLYDKCTSI